jgi:hypothetical protein
MAIGGNGGVIMHYSQTTRYGSESTHVLQPANHKVWK